MTIAGANFEHTTQLTGIDRIDDVDDLGRRNAHRLARQAGIRHITRMPAEKVIGDPAADAVKLDPLADDGAARHRLVAAQRQHLCRQHLQLQRDHQAVLRPARPEAEEHLAGDEHLAGGTPLQAVEVGEAVGVGLVGPLQPQRLHHGLQRRIADQRRRLDAGADNVPAQLSMALAA